MNNGISLSEFQAKLGNSIRMNREIQNVWVIAEFSDLRVNGGHCYMELIEKDENGTLRAKIRAMIWRGTLGALNAKFRQATGRDISNGMKVMVLGSATHHNLYGLSFTINDIDPSYTLGDMERLRQEILLRLTREGVINRNKSLSPPLCPQRIAVISAEGAAGYGDFMNQILNNPDGFAIYTGLFPAVLQGERTVPTVLEALSKVEQTREMWDAVVIIRGGGATTDLNSFDNYDLAYRVATFPLPVIVGIGHERDRTVLDEIACVRCKTPTAVAEYIIGELRTAYTHATDLVRRIARYASDAMRGEHLRISSLVQSIPARAQNKILNSRMKLNDLSARLKSGVDTRIASSGYALERIASRLANDAKMKIATGEQKLKGIEDMLRVLSPENTLKRGYSITRVNGKAVNDPEAVKEGDIIETTLSGGVLQSLKFRN